DFEPDAPLGQQDCGRCGRCIAACPGRALSPEGEALDSRRCRSYLTIEHRGTFPEHVDLGGRIFGCDICQEVCPWNDAPGFPALPEFEPRPAMMTLDRDRLERMDQAEFSRTFRGSAVKRTKFEGLRRNLESL
ncbi:MAG: 4Fe-4S dicluster domain-containing protein, partial [Clostridium sp.]|nr:4Fe-4S dicluster domain-containing protein [Clostridium sp.]